MAEAGTAEIENAVAESQDEAGDNKYKMSLKVNIDNVGPCRKHVRVTVPRTDITHFENEAVTEVVETATVPGFRRGKIPAALARKKFKEEISGSVRQRVLMISLEQLAEENKLDPINEPDFEIESLKIPDEGDFDYEFDVEVRPEFEIPEYGGLTIKRPVREVTDADVDAYIDRYVAPYGALVTHEGPAEKDDYVVCAVEFTHNGQPFRKLSSVNLQVRPTVRFRDVEIAGFDKLMLGATPGTVKATELTVSVEAEQIEMRGEKLSATLTVGEVKRYQKPERNAAFYDKLGYDDEEALKDEVRGMLLRQVTYQQRQECRRQVLEKITESASWDLPEKLVAKQTENALRREILEMQQAGFTSEQIVARENELRQQSISSTRQALKEHFVLDKIATKENIEATPVDIDSEIHLMAIQRGESPRRVRARLQKSGVIENLEAQIRERKAVDFILKTAKFDDVPTPAPVPDDSVHALSISVCGISSVSVEPDDDDEDKS